MPLKDVVAATIVIVVWGANFVAIKVAVDDVPPMLLGALRFILVAFPAVFFVARPRIALRYVVGYGLTICLAQFAFLFLAIRLGMPAGLASLVVQAQSFFTVMIAALVFKEPIRANHVAGITLAIAGLSMLNVSDGQTAVPWFAFLLTLLSALCWAWGNIILKGAGEAGMLSVVVWGALVAPLPFLLLSVVFEGPDLMLESLLNIRWQTIVSLLYLSGVASLTGYVLWGQLMARHPVARIAPLSLLIPVVALLCTSWFLGERLGLWQWFGGLVILVGLAVNLFGGRWLVWLRTRT